MSGIDASDADDVQRVIELIEARGLPWLIDAASMAVEVEADSSEDEGRAAKLHEMSGMLRQIAGKVRR